jgi:hypothetical protein
MNTRDAAPNTGTLRTLTRGVTNGCFFGGATALLSAPYWESPFHNHQRRPARDRHCLRVRGKRQGWADIGNGPSATGTPVISTS